MHFPRRRTVLKVGLAASTIYGLGTGFARAQSLPESARILVGFPPGGSPDLIARRLAAQLTGKLAKSVIVDNRPGAAGRIAVDIARQSPPDGTTLLLTPAGVVTINPHSYKKLSYDPFKDFAPIGVAALIDYAFAVGPAVPAEVTNIADFAKWAKAQKGKVDFGTPAAGSPVHFMGELLSKTLELGMTHVPYRGGVAAMNDVLGGQIAAVAIAVADLVPYANAGKLRILGSTGRTRSKFAPNLPTFFEQKVSGLDLSDWNAVYMVGNPTPEVVARVAPLVFSATSAPQYVQGLAAINLEAASSTPQELDKLGRAGFERWGPIVRASGFVADA